MKGLLWGLCFLLFAVSGWAKDKKVTGTGYVLMSQRPSEVRFEKISVQQGITLYVTLDKTATISVESDDNILPYIKTEIKNNQLNVYIEPGISIRPLHGNERIGDLTATCSFGGCFCGTA